MATAAAIDRLVHHPVFVGIRCPEPGAWGRPVRGADSQKCL